MEDAVPMLHNVATNDSDATRSRAAARELAALHAFDGGDFRALDALALLIDRKFFEEKEDLELARKYAESITDEALVAAESTKRGLAVGGLLAVLTLDRTEQLLASDETEEARRQFADRYADSALLSLVPGAEEFASEPEDVELAKVGLLLPSSGKFAAPGDLARRGVDLAVDAARELGWADVEIVAIDTQGDPAVAVQALRQLHEEHKVVGVIGPLISAEAEAVAAEAEDLGLPLFELVRTEVKVWEPSSCPLCEAGDPPVKPGSRTAAKGSPA